MGFSLSFLPVEAKVSGFLGQDDLFEELEIISLKPLDEATGSCLAQLNVPVLCFGIEELEHDGYYAARAIDIIGKHMKPAETWGPVGRFVDHEGKRHHVVLPVRVVEAMGLRLFEWKVLGWPT